MPRSSFVYRIILCVLFSFLFIQLLIAQEHAFTNKYYEYAYRYEVPCSFNSTQDAFVLAQNQVKEFKIQNYQGLGSLVIQDGRSFQLMEGSQCFLSTALPTATLVNKIKDVSSELEKLDQERDKKLEGVENKITNLRTKFDEITAKGDEAFSSYEAKATKIDESINPSVDKTRENLNTELEKLNVSCEEDRLTKLSLSAALAKIDSVVASSQAKIANAASQIIAYELQKASQQKGAILTYFELEKFLNLQLIEVVRVIRTQYQIKGNIYIDFSLKKKKIAETLLEYKKTLEDSKSLVYDASNLSKFSSDLALSAKNLNVTVDDKVCSFKAIDDAPKNTHDLRLYFSESPTMCRCEYDQRSQTFDCSRRLGGTNVPKDVCHLIELNKELSTDKIKFDADYCDVLLLAANFEGDLMDQSISKGWVSHLKGLRVIRYKLSHVQPIIVEHPTDKTPPKTRVSDHPIH